MVQFTSINTVTQDEVQVAKACQEMTHYFNALMATHKKFHTAAADEPQSGSEWKQVSLIEGLLSSIVQQLVHYEGTRALTTSIVRQSSESVSSGNNTPRSTSRRFSYPTPHRVPIFERGVLWEKKRVEKLTEIRQQKIAAEIAPPPQRKPSKWDHVQSVMRRARLEEEELKRKADVEAERIAAEEARARAELVARAAAEQQLIADAQRDDLLVEASFKRAKAEAARRKAEADRIAREAREQAEREAEAKRRLVQEAFGSKGLERRPSMPNKMVWRVNSPSGLTSNVAHEYRVKDKLTNTKGVSFIMGQTVDSQDDVVQCVLFDQEVFDDHKAASWWASNEHRFATQQRKTAAAAASVQMSGKPAAAALAHAGRALSSTGSLKGPAAAAARAAETPAAPAPALAGAV